VPPNEWGVRLNYLNFFAPREQLNPREAPWENQAEQKEAMAKPSPAGNMAGNQPSCAKASQGTIPRSKQKQFRAKDL